MAGTGKVKSQWNDFRGQTDLAGLNLEDKAEPLYSLKNAMSVSRFSLQMDD